MSAGFTFFALSQALCSWPRSRSSVSDPGAGVLGQRPASVGAGTDLHGRRPAAAASGAARADGGGVVRINARPSFALRWLIPHLPAFMAAHPGVQPEPVTSTAEPARLPAGSFDGVVRRGRLRPPASE